MLLTQMWNEEAREARGLRRMSVTVSSPADERKGRDWFHAGLSAEERRLMQGLCDALQQLLNKQYQRHMWDCPIV